MSFERELVSTLKEHCSDDTTHMVYKGYMVSVGHRPDICAAECCLPAKMFPLNLHQMYRKPKIIV